MGSGFYLVLSIIGAIVQDFEMSRKILSCTSNRMLAAALTNSSGVITIL